MDNNYNFFNEFKSFVLFFSYILPHVVQELLHLFAQEQKKILNKTHLTNKTEYSEYNIKPQMTCYFKLGKY